MAERRSVHAAASTPCSGLLLASRSRMSFGGDVRTLVQVSWRMLAAYVRGRLTSQCSRPGLAMLAPAADRQR